MVWCGVAGVRGRRRHTRRGLAGCVRGREARGERARAFDRPKKERKKQMAAPNEVCVVIGASRGLGAAIAGDAAPYQYLVESIRKFPSKRALAGMMEAAGFGGVRVESFAAGAVALHLGWKL